MRPARSQRVNELSNPLEYQWKSVFQYFPTVYASTILEHDFQDPRGILITSRLHEFSSSSKVRSPKVHEDGLVHQDLSAGSNLSIETRAMFRVTINLFDDSPEEGTSAHR